MVLAGWLAGWQQLAAGWLAGWLAGWRPTLVEIEDSRNETKGLTRSTLGRGRRIIAMEIVRHGGGERHVEHHVLSRPKPPQLGCLFRICFR